jgi:hypothetical protein
VRLLPAAEDNEKNLGLKTLLNLSPLALFGVKTGALPILQGKSQPLKRGVIPYGGGVLHRIFRHIEDEHLRQSAAHLLALERIVVEKSDAI